MLMPKHDPRDPAFRDPPGAAPSGTTVTLKILAPRTFEVRDAFRRAFGRMEFPQREYEAPVTLDDFSQWLSELFGDDAKRYEGVLQRFQGGDVMRKGQLAAAVAEIKLLKD